MYLATVPMGSLSIEIVKEFDEQRSSVLPFTKKEKLQACAEDYRHGLNLKTQG